jgi:LemA protein
MQLDERCESAFADVDVQLKHRHNLIPGLVETVRGFASHERGVLTEGHPGARRRRCRPPPPNMRLEAETQLGQSLTALMSVVENNPEIAASGHFASCAPNSATPKIRSRGAALLQSRGGRI